MPQEPGAAECGPNPSGGSSSGRWATSMALRNVCGARGSGSVGPRLVGETGDNQAVVCMVASRSTTAHAPAALPLFLSIIRIHAVLSAYRRGGKRFGR